MKKRTLSFQSRKALSDTIGEAASLEILELISQMANEIETLRRERPSIVIPDQSSTEKTTSLYPTSTTS